MRGTEWVVKIFVCLVTMVTVVPTGLHAGPAGMQRSGAVLGRIESGAARPDGYLVEEVPCLPLKRFAEDAGFQTNVSPSGRFVLVLVGHRSAMVGVNPIATIADREFKLPLTPFKKNGDLYVPLEFFEKVFPATFDYSPASRLIVVQFSDKNLRIPVLPLGSLDSTSDP